MPEDKKIEVEVQSVEEVNEALENHVDIIMLDNMVLDMMLQCIALINGKAKTEISGGVTYERLEEISTTGADFVSVGALTHSAPAVDISMCITPK
jgi:nicotinate-nucleotide pyrophosphorylase (carboxylating)